MDKSASDASNRNPTEINIMKNTVQFSSQGHSAFYSAQSVVDFAENGKSVSIKNCRFPFLIFAEMARREHLSFGFQVQWIKDDEVSKGSTISGNSEITVNSGNLTAFYNLEITTVKDLIIKRPLKILSHESPFEKNGIRCDLDHWKAICAKAKEVLVPDSQQSHGRAGAEVDDSY